LKSSVKKEKEKMIVRSLVGLFVLVAVALALTSCENATGGGWIPALNDPGAKATFGFTMHCKDDADGIATVTGSLEFHDPSVTMTAPNGKPMSLGIHGVTDAFSPLSCSTLDVFGNGPYRGTYTPQPATLGAGGSFTLSIQDNGTKGPDVLSLALVGDVFGGYSNSGTLGGGQITVRMD
jgi:hypothetical protein